MQKVKEERCNCSPGPRPGVAWIIARERKGSAFFNLNEVGFDVLFARPQLLCSFRRLRPAVIVFPRLPFFSRVRLLHLSRSTSASFATAAPTFLGWEVLRFFFFEARNDSFFLALLLLYYLFSQPRVLHSSALLENDTIVIVGGIESSKTGEIVKSK